MISLIPAYRIKRADGGESIAFRCPHCRAVHTHGLPDGEGAIQDRVSHCHDSRSPWFGREYRLVVVGEVGAPRALPRITAADAGAFGSFIESEYQRGMAEVLGGLAPAVRPDA
jgi:hypothetical protein